MPLLKVIAIGLAFMMISWSVIAIMRGHYYGSLGLALSWIALGFGIAIVIIKTGMMRILRPPLLYIYMGFFLFMFANTMWGLV